MATVSMSLGCESKSDTGQVEQSRSANALSAPLAEIVRLDAGISQQTCKHKVCFRPEPGKACV